MMWAFGLAVLVQSVLRANRHAYPDQSYSCHSELEASDENFEVLSLNGKGLLGWLGASGKAFLPADALAVTPLAAAHIPRSAPNLYLATLSLKQATKMLKYRA